MTSERSSDARLGLIQVYTGTGKGKTTAAIGAGIRAVGQGLRVHMIQFLKGGDNSSPYGEVRAIEQIPRFTLEQFGPSHFIKPGEISDEDREIVKRGLKRSGEVLSSGNYDLVILDEIHVALNYGLLTLEEVTELMECKPPQVELVMTGRGAPQTVIDQADLATEMRELKHPLSRGIQGRIGIEF